MSIAVALQFDIYYLDLHFSTTILLSLFRQMKIIFTCNNTDKGNLNNNNLKCRGYGVSSQNLISFNLTRFLCIFKKFPSTQSCKQYQLLNLYFVSKINFFATIRKQIKSGNICNGQLSCSVALSKTMNINRYQLPTGTILPETSAV